MDCRFKRARHGARHIIHSIKHKVGGVTKWFKRKIHSLVHKIKRGASWVKHKAIGGAKKVGHAVGAAGAAGAAAAGGLIGGLLAGLFGPSHAPPQQSPAAPQLPPPVDKLPPDTPLERISPQQLGFLDKLAMSLGGAKTVGELQHKKNMLKYGLLGAVVLGGAVLLMSHKKKAKA